MFLLNACMTNIGTVPAHETSQQAKVGCGSFEISDRIQHGGLVYKGTFQARNANKEAKLLCYEKIVFWRLHRLFPPMSKWEGIDEGEGFPPAIPVSASKLAGC